MNLVYVDTQKDNFNFSDRTTKVRVTPPPPKKKALVVYIFFANFFF